jgi:hypothetical protein
VTESLGKPQKPSTADFLDVDPASDFQSQSVSLFHLSILTVDASEIEDHHVVSAFGGHVPFDDSWIFTGGFDPPHILPHPDGKTRRMFSCRACEFKLSSCISPTFTNYLVAKKGAR